MTIDEMISELRRRKDLHGGECEVLVTWQGTYNDVDLKSIYLDKGRALLIDAYDCYFKEDCQHPDDVPNNPAEDDRDA